MIQFLITVLVVIFCLLSSSKGMTQNTSDSSSLSMRVLTGASGSITEAVNWNGSAYGSTAFQGYADMIRQGKQTKWNVQHTVHLELGFTRYRDSLWLKHADQFRFQLMWSRSGSSGRHSWNVSGRTQLLSSYLYYYDYNLSATQKKWTGTLLNPAEVETGYGFCFPIKNCGTINLAIATIRLRHVPVLEEIVTDKSTFKTHRGKLSLDYGCGVQLLFLKAMGDHIDWYFTGKMFLNGAGSDNFNSDLLNRLSVKIWKFFQIRLESRAVYEPVFSHKMQFRNELLAGVFVDFREQAKPIGRSP